MNCKQCEEHLLEYLDGELLQPLRVELEESLEHCEECRQKLESYRVTLGVTRKHLVLHQPPERLELVIMRAAKEALEEKEKAVPVAWWRVLFASPSFRPALSFGLLALVVGAAYLLYRPPGSPDRMNAKFATQQPAGQRARLPLLALKKADDVRPAKRAVPAVQREPSAAGDVASSKGKAREIAVKPTAAVVPKTRTVAELPVRRTAPRPKPRKMRRVRRRRVRRRRVRRRRRGRRSRRSGALRFQARGRGGGGFGTGLGKKPAARRTAPRASATGGGPPPPPRPAMQPPTDGLLGRKLKKAKKRPKKRPPPRRVAAPNPPPAPRVAVRRDPPRTVDNVIGKTPIGDGGGRAYSRRTKQRRSDGAGELAKAGKAEREQRSQAALSLYLRALKTNLSARKRRDTHRRVMTLSLAQGKTLLAERHAASYLRLVPRSSRAQALKRVVLLFLKRGKASAATRLRRRFSP